MKGDVAIRYGLIDVNQAKTCGTWDGVSRLSNKAIS
jgi:hypothetical protein